MVGLLRHSVQGSTPGDLECPWHSWPLTIERRVIQILLRVTFIFAVFLHLKFKRTWVGNVDRMDVHLLFKN